MNKLLTLCAAFLAATSLDAQIQIPPADLQPGDQYRILFVTESRRNASSTDIADYNAFVTADANASPSLAALNTQFYAVGCTQTVNARQNTGTEPLPAGSTGVPIYLISGQRVFDNYDDLWGFPRPLVAPNVTSLGNPTSQGVVTGGVFDGTQQGPFNATLAALGMNPVWGGNPNVTNPGWMGAGLGNPAGESAMYGMTDVLSVPSPSMVEDLGPACSSSRSFLFRSTGPDSYSVSNAGSAQFDPVIGILAGATFDDAISAVNLDLGFAFPFPTSNGNPQLLEQFVRIDPNGRILPESSGQVDGIANPTFLVRDFLANGYPAICPFWTDWNVEEANSDGIYWKTEPGKAVFTWNNVAQFDGGSGNGPLMTVQCTLYANGDVLVVLEDVRRHNMLTQARSDEALIGISSGDHFGSAPSLDLSLIQIGSTPPAAPAYEQFQIGTLDLPDPDPVLASLNSPVLGSTFQYEIQGAPTFASSGLYVIGFDRLPTPLPLTLIGFAEPCSLQVDFVETQAAMPIPGTGGFTIGSLAIPASPSSLLGLQVYIQAATIGSPLLESLELTNTLRVTLGDR